MKIIKIVAALLAALLLLSGFALAAESVDKNRDVRLIVQIQDEGAPLVGVRFRIYRIAGMDASGKPTPVSPFDRYNVELNGLSESELAGVASTLEGYVLRDQPSPAYSGFTGTSGMVSFPLGKKQGLYLVLGERYSANGKTYTIQPSVVQLPGWNAVDQKWDYNVKLSAKYETGTDASTVSRKVLKIWKNAENDAARPKEVEVSLLRNGEVFDTVKLSAKNLWRHTWNELDAKQHWTVVEKELKNYDVLVTREGITFVVTNTYDPGNPNHPGPTPTPKPPSVNPPGNPKLPQTGQLWWPVPMLASLGLLLIVIGLLRRRGS